MTAAEPAPRLYLVTPENMPAEQLAELLPALLADGHVACLRLARSAEADEGDWTELANRLIEPSHADDVPLLVTDHHRLVAPLGLDGVHLSVPRASVGAARRALGPDRVVGAAGGTTRHAAMTLAEAGADYVSLGPVRSDGALGDGVVAERELFAWWADMIETPVVAEGGVLAEDVADLAELVDFFVPDTAFWRAADPVAELTTYVRALED